MHPDARTNAPDTDYFFLGEGNIAAAIQWSRNGETAPYGLLLWRSGTFPRKESTLLFQPEFGLDRTMLTVTAEGVRYRPKREEVRVWWASTDVEKPAAAVEWKAGEVTVRELFFPFLLPFERDRAHNGPNDEGQTLFHLVRQVFLSRTESATDAADVSVELAFYPNPYVLPPYPAAETGHRLVAAGGGMVCRVCPAAEETEARVFERFITVHRNLLPAASDVPETDTAGNATVPPVTFLYLIADNGTAAVPHHIPTPKTNRKECEPDSGDFTGRLLRQFDVARIGLHAAVSPQGAFDASIWQYGYEWGQDAAMCASAAVYAGDFELARRLLERILTALSNDEGSIAESSRFRDGDPAELNANGAVLTALRDYAALDRDTSLIERYWERIAAIAELPLRDDYLHESGLIAGRRDLWERLPWTGVRTGFDTAANTFCAEGLKAAAELAAMIGRKEEEGRWREAGETMEAALTGHNRFSCIEEGRIIARRLTDGSVQTEMIAEEGYHDERYAPYVPVAAADPTPRPCEPDSVAALPILYGIVDPASDVARATLDHLRTHLWDTTGIGGYARSPLASDPDSPGPWPFVTAWMAEAELRAGLTERAKETTEWLLDAAGAGGSWFEYYGERKSPPFPPVGVIVWGWGQYLLLAARGWMGIEFNAERLRIAPRITGFRHTLRTAAHAIRIEVNGLARATTDGIPTELRNGGIELPLPLTADRTVVFSR